MSTPMAIIASKGALLAVLAAGLGFAASADFVRSVTEVEERRSVALAMREPALEDVDWSWEEAYMLLDYMLATLPQLVLE